MRPGIDHSQKFGNFPAPSGDTRAKADDKPPTLPPRNYRKKHGSGSGAKKGQQPLPQAPLQRNSSGAEENLGIGLPQPKQTAGAQSAGSFKIGPGSPATPPRNANMDTFGVDSVSTPEADVYADQLRQQALRFSKTNRSLLSAARYQSKPLAEMKTNIVVSRPVEQPPVAQEAKGPPPLSTDIKSPAPPGLKPGTTTSTSPESRLPQTVPSEGRVPQPIHRSTVVPQDLNYVGLSEPESNAEPQNRSPSQNKSQDKAFNVTVGPVSNSSPSMAADFQSPAKLIHAQASHSVVPVLSPQGAPVSVISPQMAAPLRSTGSEAGRFTNKELPPPPPSQPETNYPSDPPGAPNQHPLAPPTSEAEEQPDK